MARFEIQSLKTDTTLQGLSQHPEGLPLPAGEALELDITVTPPGPGRTVKPKEKSGGVVLVAPTDIADQSPQELLKSVTIEGDTARIGLVDAEAVDVGTFVPLAQLVDELGLALIVEVGPEDG
ncbi:MAG: hypothetical protein ACRDK4_02800 [Solirubrobacteraceae bacterium]